MKLPILVLAIPPLTGCQSNPRQPDNGVASTSAYSTDAEYGFTRDKPIMVGGWQEVYAAKIYGYLNILKGPNGEEITYKRRQACCGFETPNGIDGIGLLDSYQISYNEIPEPVVLYFNGYDSEPLYVPAGFTIP